MRISTKLVVDVFIIVVVILGNKGSFADIVVVDVDSASKIRLDHLIEIPAAATDAGASAAASSGSNSSPSVAGKRAVVHVFFFFVIVVGVVDIVDVVLDVRRSGCRRSRGRG